MEIGKTKRIIESEPMKDPVPDRHVNDPLPAPQPQPSPDKEPAKALVKTYGGPTMHERWKA